MGNACYSDFDTDHDQWDGPFQPAAARTFDFVDPENRELDDIWQHFTKKRKLGEGASCSVFEVVRKSDNLRVAMKQLDKKDKWNPMLFEKEVDILKKLEHPSILQYEGCYIDRRNFYVCTTFLQGGELFARVKQLRHFSESQAAEVLETILLAIQHMHDRHIVHRDLKPENIVYDSPGPHGQIVIIDLGDARLVSDEEIIDDFVGTAFYLAPECVRHRKGWELKKSDMWAIGVIAYVLLTGSPPFYGNSSREILQRIVHAEVRFPRNVKLSNSCRNFLLSLIQKDPRRRLSAQRALQHPWIVSEAKKNKHHLGDQVLKNISNYYEACKLKKLIVHMMVEDMTEDDKKIIKNAFRQLDYDGDGFITEPEMARFLQTTGMNEEAAAKRAGELMSNMDEDGDGRIDLREFTVSRVMASLGSSEDVMRKAFDELDVDHDGLVDVADLREYFKNSLKEEHLEVLLQEIDDDGDGKITFEEFRHAMQQTT